MIIRDSDDRLAIVSVLLTLLIPIVMLEPLVFFAFIRKAIWYTRLRQWNAPISFALLTVGLVSSVLSDVDFTALRGEMNSRCNDNVAADIAGEGIRMAAFFQVGVLIIVLVLSSFHQEATDVKELGQGLTLTRTSLAIALIARVGTESLKPMDAVISAMSLDGQAAALPIQLLRDTDRTLASGICRLHTVPSSNRCHYRGRSVREG